MLDPAPPPEGRRGGAVHRARRRAARRVVRRRGRRGEGDRLRERGDGRVRPGRGQRRLLVPRGEHPAAGRAPRHRAGHRPRPRGAPARHRPGRAAAARGTRRVDVGSRDRGAPLRRGRRRRLPPGERRAAPVPHPRARGRARRRGLHRRLGREPVLRRAAGQGDRVGAHAGGSRATARRRAARRRAARARSTNRDLLVRVLEDDDFLAGRIDTGFLDRLAPVDDGPRAPVVARPRHRGGARGAGRAARSVSASRGHPRRLAQRRPTTATRGVRRGRRARLSPTCVSWRGLYPVC